MCRYATNRYKPHYACFNCRKTFKRKLLWDIQRSDEFELKAAKCPECGQLMACMGKDFESPKKENVKAWEHMHRLYSVGIMFHSCGCSGPGYIPDTKETLVAYFEKLLTEYHGQLNFWRQHAEPASNKGTTIEYITKLSDGVYTRKSTETNEDAIKFWIGKIKDIEQKLESVKTTA